MYTDITLYTLLKPFEHKYNEERAEENTKSHHLQILMSPKQIEVSLHFNDYKKLSRQKKKKSMLPLAISIVFWLNRQQEHLWCFSLINNK